MLKTIVTALQRLKLSIRYKIGLAFSLLLLCFIVNGVISAILLLNIQQTQNTLTNTAVDFEQLQRIDLAYKTQLDLYGDAIFLLKSPYFRDNFGNTIISDQLTRANPSSATFTDDFKSRFARLYGVVYQDLISLQPLIKAGNFDEAKAKWQEYTPDFKKVTDLTEARLEELKLQRDTNSRQLESTIEVSLIILGIVVAFSVLLTLGLLFLVGKVLIIPLNNLRSNLRRVAEGELEQEVDVINQDEIGDLGDSFSRAIQTLREVLNGVRITEQLRGVTTHLAAACHYQTSGSQEQVIAITQAITMLEELQSMAGQIATGSRTVATLTSTTLGQIEQVARAGDNSRECANQMVVVVENTIRGVDQVSQQVGNFNRVMQEVAAKSQAINGVVIALGNIAEEVHLLSLNASIEAAGAGQFGERFKVIARQIKELANRANGATGQAQTLLNEVQEGVQSAVAEVEKGQEEVRQVVETNTRVGASLQQLQNSAAQLAQAVTALQTLAGQVNEQTEHIKQATTQQQYSSQHIMDSVYSIRQIAEQTADNSREIAANTSQLDELAFQLNGVLANIK